MDALTEHRDEYGLDEFRLGYLVDLTKELEPIFQIGVQLQADVFAFDGHGLRGMSAKKGLEGGRIRSAPYVKLVDDLQATGVEALKLLSAELRNDGTPLTDGGGTNAQRPRDVRSELVLIQNSLFEHSRHSTTVDLLMQPQFITSVLTSVYMDTTLAERLDKALQTKGANASDLADACDVSPAAVSKWLGKTEPVTKTLTAANYVKAAKFLDVREEWLRTGKGPKDLAAADQEERQADRVLEMLENLRGPLAALITAIDGVVKARSEEPQRKRTTKAR